jgi:glucokinase-like ROK family protein
MTDGRGTLPPPLSAPVGAATAPHSQAVLPVGNGAINGALMRRHNGARLLDIVRRHGPISRASLARASRLSAPTVSALVHDLVTRKGLLRLAGIGASSGGRRPVMVEFRSDFGCVVAVDLGSTTIRLALADLQGRVLHRRQEQTPASSRDAVIERLERGIRGLFSDSGIDPKKLFAIGIGAPGMTDVARGVVISAANLKGWTNVPLRDLLQARFGAPVVVDNDVNMAALGELWSGCATNQPNFVFVALGAGVGAGIIVDGRLHRGSSWYAGEISHMNLDYRCWRQDFGEQGYLERRAGAAAIAHMGQRAVGSRRRRGRPAASLTARVFEAARQGHKPAQRVVEQVAVYLGTAVANIVTVLDPTLVVFGGGVSQVGDQLLEPVRQVVAHIVPNCPEIRLSALGDEAQLHGSLYSVLQLAETRLLEQL